MIKIKRLTDKAKLPTQGSSNCAGLDLYSAEEKVVQKNTRCIITTDLAIELPEGTYGRISERSGLALHHGIKIGGGVIDRDYTGAIKIILYNFSDKDYQVSTGDKIAQLICEKYIMPTIQEVNEINITLRGANAFGSTGK